MIRKSLMAIDESIFRRKEAMRNW